MASQSASGARDASSAAGFNTKVPVPSSKPSIGRNIEQPPVGKQTVNGGSAMPGSTGKGQAVKTVKSNPVQGKNVQGNTAMGSGSVIPGMI